MPEEVAKAYDVAILARQFRVHLQCRSQQDRRSRRVTLRRVNSVVTVVIATDPFVLDKRAEFQDSPALQEGKPVRRRSSAIIHIGGLSRVMAT